MIRAFFITYDNRYFHKDFDLMKDLVDFIYRAKEVGTQFLGYASTNEGGK